MKKMIWLLVAAALVVLFCNKLVFADDKCEELRNYYQASSMVVEETREVLEDFQKQKKEIKEDIKRSRNPEIEKETREFFVAVFQKQLKKTDELIKRLNTELNKLEKTKEDLRVSLSKCTGEYDI